MINISIKFFYLNVFILKFFLLIQLSLCNEEEKKVDLSRGFGEDINWLRFDDALELAKEQNKPIFLLIHKTWCGACKNLKSNIKNSAKFKELSEDFLMVNLEDDEEPKENVYYPDGGYIPRILFLDSTGLVRNEIINENGNPQYKYYYSNADQVIASMEKAKELLNEDDIEYADEDEELEEEEEFDSEYSYTEHGEL